MTHEEIFQEAVNRMQQGRSDFLAALDGLSQPQMDFRPAPSSWSIGEVAHHVVLTERMLRTRILELLQAGQDGQGARRQIGFAELPMGPRMIPDFFLRFPPVQLSFSLMNAFLPQSVQSFLLANPFLKVRTAPSVEPHAGLAKEEIVSLLRQERAGTLQALEPGRAWDLSRYRWHHPMMGAHDIYQTLDLLAGHDRRHQVQIAGIQRSPLFPSG